MEYKQVQVIKVVQQSLPPPKKTIGVIVLFKVNFVQKLSLDLRH